MLSTDMGAAPTAPGPLQDSGPGGASRRSARGARDRGADFGEMFDRATTGGRRMADGGQRQARRSGTVANGTPGSATPTPSSPVDSPDTPRTTRLQARPAHPDDDRTGQDVEEPSSAVAVDPRLVALLQANPVTPPPSHDVTAPPSDGDTVGQPTAALDGSILDRHQAPTGLSTAGSEGIDAMPGVDDAASASAAGLVQTEGPRAMDAVDTAANERVDPLAGIMPLQPPAQSGDVAAQMRPQAPASAAGPERASAATANAASAQPPDERVLAMQELRAALTRESAGSDAQPTTPDVSSPAAPQPPVAANASAVTVPPSVGARTAAAPHTPLAQPATLRGSTTTPSIDESSVAATPPSALTSATAESVSPANSQGVDAPTRGAEAERVRGVPPPAPPTVTAVPAEAREAGSGGPGARGRQLSTFEAVMSPAPRPSTRVAHAIAAFQAVANAAALQPVGTGLNSLVQAAGTPAAILDRELPTQLVHGIRVQADSGGGAAQLRLNPTFLGGVTVGVQVDGTNVVASLHASNAEVREWMQRNEQVLRQSLADQGLNLQRLVIVDEDAPNAGREDGGSDTRQQQEQQQPRRPRRLENDSTFEIVL